MNNERLVPCGHLTRFSSGYSASVTHRAGSASLRHVLARNGVKAVVYDRHPEIGGLLSFVLAGFLTELASRAGWIGGVHLRPSVRVFAVGLGLALGFGAPQRADMAAAWYEDALSAIGGGAAEPGRVPPRARGRRNSR